MSTAKTMRLCRYSLLKSFDTCSLSSSKYLHNLPFCCQYRQKSSGSHNHEPTTANSPETVGAKNTATGSSAGSGREGETMKSWQMHSYGGPSELQLSTRERIPPLNGPDEVLVKVHAASVNPIDLAMTRG